VQWLAAATDAPDAPSPIMRRGGDSIITTGGASLDDGSGSEGGGSNSGGSGGRASPLLSPLGSNGIGAHSSPLSASTPAAPT